MTSHRIRDCGRCKVLYTLFALFLVLGIVTLASFSPTPAGTPVRAPRHSDLVHEHVER